MIKSVKYFLEAIFIYFFFLIGRIIGLNASRLLFSNIFQLIGPLIKSEKILKKNLKKFLKEDFEEKNKQIASNMWLNYGMTFIEYVFLKKFKNENSHMLIEGEEILNDIKKNNKQVVFVSGHFANFELMSMEIVKKKINLATIYRPLNNYFLNPFMEYLRKKYICNNQIPKGMKGVKDVIKFVKNKHSIALMIDQRVSEGEKIKFFDQEALTTTLPAQIALNYSMDIVPIFIERKQMGKFTMKVYDPINYSNFKNKLDLSKNLNQILEQMINKNPNHWIWTHDRWK